MNSNEHNNMIRDAFSEQAATFSQLRTIANPENVKWILDNMPLEPQYQVLDVAAGTGALSRAMAPFVRQVTSVDLTPAMLIQGQMETSISNIRFEQGLAEQLPHGRKTFDLAVNRFAVHHIPHPEPIISEMARVVRDSGWLVLIDLICTDDPREATQYNYVERLRDPSHVAALKADALISLLKGAGIDVTNVATRRIEVNLTGWMDQTKTPASVREFIIASLTNEINGREATGLQPFIQNGELMFIHTWCIVVGRKITG